MTQDLSPTDLIVLRVIQEAAKAGQRAPTNAELADRSGLSSAGTASAVVIRLERRRLIKVERYFNQRVIELPTGERTEQRSFGSRRKTGPHRKDGFQEIVGTIPGRRETVPTTAVVFSYRPDPPPPKTCQWLDGDPADRRFCGRPVTEHPDGSRSSYCAEHHSRCYMKGHAA